MSNSVIICTYFNIKRDYCRRTIIIILINLFNYIVKSIRATLSETLDCLVFCALELTGQLTCVTVGSSWLPFCPNAEQLAFCLSQQNGKELLCCQLY